MLSRGSAISRRGLLAAAAAAAAQPPFQPAVAAAGSHVDLTGVWTNATYTPLERPAELPRLAVTPGEAERFEAPRRVNGGRPASALADIGQSESEFIEMGSGLMRLGGEIRASIIVDPPDGQVPYRPEVRARLAAEANRRGLDHPEQRPLFERCLASSGSGAPIIPSMDANTTAIVQTRDAVVVVSEKLNEARVIELGDAPARQPIPSWTGVSIGRWKGRTLVVETSGLRPRPTDRFFFVLGPASRVLERFTRTDRGEIHYGFTVEDPDLFMRPWRGELLFVPASGPLYEYACHEGNYSLANILRGARVAEAGPGLPAAAPAR